MGLTGILGNIYIFGLNLKDFAPFKSYAWASLGLLYIETAFNCRPNQLSIRQNRKQKEFSELSFLQLYKIKLSTRRPWKMSLEKLHFSSTLQGFRNYFSSEVQKLLFSETI